jgi:hypothetical protein
MISSKSVRIIGSALLIYTLANLALFFNRSIMWDCWLCIRHLHQNDYSGLFAIFNQSRLFHTYYTYRALDTLGDMVVLSKILIFFSWLIAGMCLYYILRDVFRLKARDIFFTLTLFLLTPVFIVKHDVSVLFYSISNTAFFMGAFLYFTRVRTSTRVAKYFYAVFAGICFIIAFLTNSFLPFFGAIILYVMYESMLVYKSKHKHITIYSLYSIASKHWIIIAFPFVFYLAQHFVIGDPVGIYADYNQIIVPGLGITSVISMYINDLWNFFAYGLGWPILASTSILERKYFLIIFIISTALIHVLLKRLIYSLPQEKDDSEYSYKKYFYWGLILFFFGSIAYVLVHKSPHPYGNGFGMRHALLLPLPVALLLMSGINILIKEKWRYIVQTVILALFATFTMYSYYAADMDHYKQMSIIMSLKHNASTMNQLLDKGGFVIFDDMLQTYNWLNRGIPPLEQTGYLYESLGRNIPAAGIAKYNECRGEIKKCGELIMELNVMNPRMYTPTHAVLVTVHSEQAPEPTVMKWLKLRYKHMILDDQSFSDYLENTLGITTKATLLYY